MRLKNAVFLVVGFSMVVAGLFLALDEAQAAGKKPLGSGPAIAGGSCPLPSKGADPVRQVVVPPVGTKAFHLPNGSEVNLQMDLDAMFRDVLGANSNFATVTGGIPDDGCGNHLEVQATVSVFQLDAAELNTTFGYAGQENSTITNFTGTANVKVGRIAMEFGIAKCDSKICQDIITSTADQATVGTNLNFTLNFGLITTGTTLVMNSPLGGILRAIMATGVRGLVNSPKLREVPWSARVISVDPGKGTFLFDQGFQSRIDPGQNFTVVTPLAGGNACSLLQAVADGHTTQVSPVSSTVQVDSSYDPRGVRVGDVVMIK